MLRFGLDGCLPNGARSKLKVSPQGLHVPIPRRCIQSHMSHVKTVFLLSSVSLLALMGVACSGNSFGVLQPTPEDLCKCLPIEPDIADYRHVAKHVPIPDVPIQEATVETILGWAQDPVIPPDAPRTGRELEVFHIATAFLQNASVNAVDCDVVMEISHTADKSSS